MFRFTSIKRTYFLFIMSNVLQFVTHTWLVFDPWSWDLSFSDNVGMLSVKMMSLLYSGQPLRTFSNIVCRHTVYSKKYCDSQNARRLKTLRSSNNKYRSFHIFQYFCLWCLIYIRNILWWSMLFYTQPSQGKESFNVNTKVAPQN